MRKKKQTQHYVDNKNLGSFILIDRLTNNTVGMGLVQHAIEHTSWVDRYVKQRDKYWVRSCLLYTSDAADE